MIEFRGRLKHTSEQRERRPSDSHCKRRETEWQSDSGTVRMGLVDRDRSPGNLLRTKTKIGFSPGTGRSCRRYKLDLKRDTRHAPAITTTVNDISPLARRAASNLIALGQDVGMVRGENGRELGPGTTKQREKEKEREREREWKEKHLATGNGNTIFTGLIIRRACDRIFRFATSIRSIRVFVSVVTIEQVVQPKKRVLRSESTKWFSVFREVFERVPFVGESQTFITFV